MRNQLMKKKKKKMKNKKRINRIIIVIVWVCTLKMNNIMINLNQKITMKECRIIKKILSMFKVSKYAWRI